MILFPAIDLKDGRCVRLRQGDMAQATVFNDDPSGQAEAFAAAGCRWLHVVDLNGAFEGRPVNAAAVTAILNAIDIPVQLGGGIRSLATIEHWLSHGVARVILGTAALRDPALVADACRAFPGRVAVGVDARKGRVAVGGWIEQSEVEAATLAHTLSRLGAAALIYTNIERDGVLCGPDIEGTLAIANAVPIPVIASGGVSSLDDLRTLRARSGDSLEGVICGRALYDGRIDVREALAVLNGERAAGAPSC